MGGIREAYSRLKQDFTVASSQRRMVAPKEPIAEEKAEGQNTKEKKKL